MTWVAASVFGFASMVMMRWTPNWLDAVLIRVAALLFAGAGAMGATGWIGDLVNWVINGAMSLLDRFGAQAVGTGIVWILATILGGLWIGALLPERLFNYQYPDWLVFAGFPLPVLLTAVPGQAGEAMRTVVLTGGEMLVGWVGGWFA
jgi:hypothetical protein